jgi:heavy metal sensor kinase
MSLTTRLSLFFLSALAVVLVGFSATLYVLAHAYLQRQVEDRLTSTLNTLEAAVDHEPFGLDWDVSEKRIQLGQEKGPETVRWQVSTDFNRRLDGSANLEGADLGVPIPVDASDSGLLIMQREGKPWKSAWRRIKHWTWTGSLMNSAAVPARPHKALLLTAAVALEPMRRTLHWLALTLAGLTAGVWLLAALACRRACRKALAPVTRMALAAREMGPPELDRRLPDPGTADELGQLHGAFNGLLDRLQQAFERQRRFTGDASHQLRTPLTAMLGQVEVALRRERRSEEYRQVLALVQNQAGRLRQIVEALLFLARADADADLADLQTIDLAAWLPEHLNNYADHPRGGDIQLHCEESAMVRVQPILLGQLVDNLLDNAFKYSEPGAAVHLMVKRDSGVATLTVQDAGEGISPEDLSHVFEPFYRSAQVRRQGKAGVGLGLAMAQRIARAIGGELTVESKVGMGSQFVLRLKSHEPQS